MSYSDTHASALALLGKKGAAVTFTRTTQGSYNPETDAATITTSTVVGKAVRVAASSADREKYAGLGLTETEVPVLFFAPTTYGDTPSVGDTCVWASTKYTTRDVEIIAPDGNVIAARILVSR
jgi:hypothetical protein|tara:strand:- start:1380 stop:1748 length:369 start_codon:yes stop_codon:yes gene_type:complete